MNTTEKLKNLWASFGFGAYFGAVGTVLNLVLTTGFSVSTPMAFSAALLFTNLSGYPLFLRGKPNQWTKDKRNWDFTTWTIINVALMLAAFFATQLLPAQ